MPSPLDILRHHVSGAVARGEKTPITEIPMPEFSTDIIPPIPARILFRFPDLPSRFLPELKRALSREGVSPIPGSPLFRITFCGNPYMTPPDGSLFGEGKIYSLTWDMEYSEEEGHSLYLKYQNVESPGDDLGYLFLLMEGEQPAELEFSPA